jgi:hypothetical protein
MFSDRARIEVQAGRGGDGAFEYRGTHGLETGEPMVPPLAPSVKAERASLGSPVRPLLHASLRSWISLGCARAKPGSARVSLVCVPTDYSNDVQR